MKIKTKNINLRFSYNSFLLKSVSKDVVKKSFLSKEVAKKEILYTSLKSFNYIKNLNSNLTFGDVLLDYVYPTPLKPNEPIDVVSNIIDSNYKLNEGWNTFSIPLDLTHIINTYENSNQYELNEVVNYTDQGIKNFLKNNLYEYLEDEIPYHFKNPQGYIEDLIIAKDNNGKAYLPEWDFSGISFFSNYQGYQIKLAKDLYIKIKGKKFTGVETFQDIILNLNNGWNLMGYPLFKNSDIKEFVSDYDNNIIIIKDNNGKAYFPEHSWNFNGIGDFQSYQGYYIKLRNL